MRKKYKWLIGTAVVLVALFFLFKTPSYPDVVNAKPAAGNQDASIIIEEFSDFQCPACGAAYPTVKQILETYGDRVQMRYKQFPLSSIHPYAFTAAEASECANDQGKFWEYADMLFANQQNLRTSDLKTYAKELGLDTKLFNACLASGKKVKIVNGEQREGIARGVQGTPTFFVNGERLESWQYDAFAQVIDDALAESS